MKGKIPLFLRLTFVTLVALLFLTLLTAFPFAASAAPGTSGPVLDEGAIASKIYDGVAPSVALTSAALTDTGPQLITVAALASTTTFTVISALVVTAQSGVTAQRQGTGQSLRLSQRIFPIAVTSNFSTTITTS